MRYVEVRDISSIDGVFQRSFTIFVQIKQHFHDIQYPGKTFDGTWSVKRIREGGKEEEEEEWKGGVIVGVGE